MIVYDARQTMLSLYLGLGHLILMQRQTGKFTPPRSTDKDRAGTNKRDNNENHPKV
jgi:hypothetical protein